MGLSDPFSTTYEGSKQAGMALGAGIESAAGSVADVMKQKNKLAQEGKQRQKSFDMLKGLGLIKEDTTPPSVDDLKADLKQKAKSMGKDVEFAGTDPMDEKSQRNWLGSLYKTFGIPMPQGQTKTTISPGVSFDLGGGVKYSSPKPQDQNTKLFKELSMEMAQERLKDSEKKTLDTEWDKLDKITNPNIATNRSPLGMAGRANMSADRALTTLNQPNITNQEAGNVMADVASIYQAGSPTEFGMSEQGYKTVQGQVAAIQQYLTGTPTDALPASVRDRLKGVLNGMKDTNVNVIKQNLNYIEKAHGDLIRKDPQKWADMKAALLTDYADEGNTPNPTKSVLKAVGLGNQAQSQQANQVGKYSLVQ